MRKLLTGAFALLGLISIAAPARADVPSVPVYFTSGPELLVVGGMCCLGLFVIAAVVIGIVFIVKHNKKKSGEQ